MDFLSENSVAGQTLLRLVSRGNAIIAELLRLSDHVPSVFFLDDKNDLRTYGQILFDFKYLKNSDGYEALIESKPELIDLDEEFRETHLPLLQRFYQLFESIYKYAKDFSRFLEDLQEGVFIQMTLESVLADEDGKQLMAEALYLFGVQLKLLDIRIEGVIRERLLIAFYRYRGHQEINFMDEVCSLCRATGFSANSPKKPANYPEEYFARVSLPSDVILMIIGRLRSDDLYGQIRAYPLPDHRSTALASQAAMLYIILYFAPEVLHKEQASMREMVDKHFPDNWVLCYYMGFTVDLSVAWDGYKAARSALANTIAVGNVKRVHQKHKTKVAACQKELKHLLTEGVLTEELVLDNIAKLLNVLRESNVTLRWLILHATTRIKKIRDLIIPDYDANVVLQLLLDTAQFEFLLKKMFNRLLDQKQGRWDECKQEASERMVELGQYFGGESALTRGVQKDEQLMTWFKDIAEKITALDYEDSTSAGRKIQQLTVALDKVEEFHQMEGLQVKQFLGDTRQYLLSMLRTVNVKEDVIVTLSLISDFGYAWQIINDYVPLMQDLIRNRPTTVIKLRSTFLKLASILDAPLIRINQCESPDLESVAEYYSGELVGFVRRVLEIIPKSMFQILREIIKLQTYHIRDVPAKIEKKELKEVAQLDERLALSRATHAISVFTEGILAMETTLVGIIKVDPKQLLEDGIRKELVGHIAESLDKVLVFKKGTVVDLEARLHQLSGQLDGFRRSFEYISDYVNIYGLKIWQEEFTRISLFSVQQECNRFLKKKVYFWQSEYYNAAIPIPTFPPQDDKSSNFVGRLARELLNLTSAGKCTYSDPLGAWLDPNGKEVIGIRTLSLLHKSIGTAGLYGVDRLLSFMIVSNLQRFCRIASRGIDKPLVDFMRSIEVSLDPIASVPQNAHKLYSNAISKLNKLPSELFDIVMLVGQVQLLRRMIQNELNFSSKLDSNILTTTLSVFNRGVMAGVHSHYRDPDNVPFPGGAGAMVQPRSAGNEGDAEGENMGDGEGEDKGEGEGGTNNDDDEHDIKEEGAPLLYEIAKYLDISGLDSPLSKIYITQKPPENFVVLIFLLTLVQLPRLGYNATFQTLSAVKKNDPVDGMPLCAGILTVLKQFHSRTIHGWLAYIGQYARGYINSVSQRDSRSQDLPSEVIAALHLLDDFCRVGGASRKVVEGYVPGFVFESKGVQ